jgi:hypothetical protein
MRNAAETIIVQCSGRSCPMENREPIHRPDDQLRDILDEPGTWVAHGHNQQVFGVGSTLRRAIDRATRYAQSGAAVVAVA